VGASGLAGASRNENPRAKRTREVVVDRSWLEQRALAYLNRFDASVARLRSVLTRAVRRYERDPDARVARAAEVEALLQRYVASGVLNDERHAAVLARSQRARGASARKIAEKLRLRGVGADAARAALVAVAHEATELDAARAFVRRKRLGPHRSPEVRAEFARKDLAALARAGFDFETARRALTSEVEPEE
jgi:regulatory protein